MWKDGLFTSPNIEVYEAGSFTTGHAMDRLIPTYEMPDDYVMFLIPRIGTPVCNAELIQVNKRLEFYPVDVYAGSTDSPEGISLASTDEEMFAEELEYPFVTIRERNTNPLKVEDIFDENGYCMRATVFVRDGAVVHVEPEVDLDAQRDFDVIDGLISDLYQ